ncbi:MAG: hypothetical protein NUW37_03290 [Planctomycetes bacterium]|nr:hypothetical protein [Planctomycetota bacterium]
MIRNVIIGFLWILLAIPGFAFAQGSGEIPFQGKLTSATGTALTGQYDFQFAAYDSPSGGSAMWTETHGAVVVQNGFYSVRLGSLIPIDPRGLMIARHLEIKVRRTGTTSYDTLLPRVVLSSAPFALVADTVDGIDSEELARYEMESGAVISSGIVVSPGSGEGPSIRFDGNGWVCTNDGVNFFELGKDGEVAEEIFHREGNLVTTVNEDDDLRIGGTLGVARDLRVGGVLSLDASESDLGTQVGDGFQMPGAAIHTGNLLVIDAMSENGASLITMMNSSGEGFNLDIVGGVTLWGEFAPDANPGEPGQVLVSRGTGIPPAWMNQIASEGDFRSDGSVPMTGAIQFSEDQTFPAYGIIGIIENMNLGPDVAMKSDLDEYPRFSDLGDYALASELVKFAHREELFGYATLSDLTNYVHVSELSNYAHVSELSNYAQVSDLSNYAHISELSNYAHVSELSNYALVSELSNYAHVSELSNYALVSELSNYALLSDLSNYALVSELSNYALLSDLSNYASFSDLWNYATLDSLSNYATWQEVDQNYLSYTGGIMEGPLYFFAEQQLPGEMVYGPISDMSLPLGGTWHLDSTLHIADLVRIYPQFHEIEIGDDQVSVNLSLSGVLHLDPTLFFPEEPASGDFVFDGITLWVHDGFNWQSIGGGEMNFFESYDEPSMMMLVRIDSDGEGDLPLLQDESLGILAFGGYDGAKIVVGTASIEAVAAEAFSPDGTGTALRFNTTGVGTIYPEVRMLIDPEGYVGIGNDHPSFTLDVAGDINFTGELFCGGEPLGIGGDGIWYYDEGGNISFLDGYVGIGTDSPSSLLHVEGEYQPTIMVRETSGFSQAVLSLEALRSYYLMSNEVGFFRIIDANEESDRFTIDDTGLVGIGPIDPQFNLDVLGDINFTGELYQNGSPFSVGGDSLWNDQGESISYLGNVAIGTSENLFGLTLGEGVQFGMVHPMVSPLAIYSENDMWVIDGETSDLNDTTLVLRTGLEDHIRMGVSAFGGASPDDIKLGGHMSVDPSILYVTAYVGIGTSMPAAPLHVVGDGIFEGYLSAYGYYGDGSQLMNIGTSNLQPGSVDSNILAYNSVSGDHIQSMSITENHLTDNCIDSGNIIDGSIEYEEMNPGFLGTSWSIASSMDLNSGLLFVDPAAEMVGVGTASPSSSFQTGGSVARKVSTFFASAQTEIFLDETHHVVICHPDIDEMTVYLPDPATCLGREYIIKYGISGQMAINISGPVEGMQGGPPLVMPGSSITLISDGLEWYILSLIGIGDLGPN